MGSGIDGTVQIHASAFVAGNLPEGSPHFEPGFCAIGRNTKVWHNAQIRDGASIGDDCVIGKDCYIEGIVGDRCKIQNGVNVYRGVVLGDEVFVGPGVVFTNDKHPHATGAWEITPTLVSSRASIGAGAVILCGVTIGEGAMVGAGAVVTHDVEPGSTVVGNPAYPSLSPSNF